MQDVEKLIQDAASSAGPFVVGLGRNSRGGSGVVLGAGRVLTLARNLRGRELTVTLAGGREVQAQLLGADPDMDVALLSADTEDLGEGPPWSMHTEADAPALPIGTTVLALADPGGRGLRVTIGHTTSAGRRFRGPRGRMIADVIEHTAPLPRGSGGGPLLDAHGGLLGLNAVRQDGGLILALPAALLRGRIEQLATGQAPQTPRLGVAIVPPRAARRLRNAVGLPELDGLLVRAVESGSPAAGAGVQRGDLIVSVAGAPVTAVDDLYVALDGATGATLVLGVVRGEQEHELAVAFGDHVEAES